TAYSYDNNDRLTQQGGVSYTYDANGNILTETEDGQVTRYHYDARNKLMEKWDRSIFDDRRSRGCRKWIVVRC
ncbi:hypothetical protein, partial [Marinobacter sp.]|uniref:hypothetical protein n=1 Tax=Marinobacter sp. TaxID=50741 RepID=UPI0034A20EE0